MGCILSSGRKVLVIAVKVGTRLYLASGHRLATCSRMNAAWLIASSTAATFAGLGLSESNSISFLAHTALQRYMGRLSSEVRCSGEASEMLPPRFRKLLSPYGRNSDWGPPGGKRAEPRSIHKAPGDDLVPGAFLTSCDIRFSGSLPVCQLHDESSLTDSPLNLGVWDVFGSVAIRTR
jgi:hypothetical protein